MTRSAVCSGCWIQPSSRPAFFAFHEKFAEVAQGVVAIDGKTLRRSFDRASGKSSLHLVSAWAVGSR
jgi:hypothetical protein